MLNPCKLVLIDKNSKSSEKNPNPSFVNSIMKELGGGVGFMGL
jgi:hypothetical protein